MVRIKNYARLNVSGGTKPGHGEPFKNDKKFKVNRDVANFCTEFCPHPNKICKGNPCKEFREKFGRRRDG